jgi:hypothetical protein
MAFLDRTRLGGVINQRVEWPEHGENRQTERIREL